MSARDGILPNLIYIGPDKAGSSWLHAVLLHHPQVFLTPAKDLYFFDRFWARGAQWYASQFRGAGPEHQAIGEVCPDYLASPEAPARMHEVIPDARLVCTLRDPATRAFSSWLYMRKHGEGQDSFAETIPVFSDLIEHGRYGSQLERFTAFYGPDRLFIGLFDDLKGDPQGFIDSLTDWAGLERYQLPEGDLEAKLPASKARIPMLAWLVRRAADATRSRNGARIVGVVKRNPLVHRLLYSPLGDAAPTMTTQERDLVRTALYDEVVRAEEISGLPLRQRWGWPLDGIPSDGGASDHHAEGTSGS